jgi:ribonuclease BN (tRNA processing enzyme)
MRLTVLGSAASYPDAGRACAGHLVQTSSTAVLLDCGNGVLSNLGQVMDPTHLDAVFVSHGHVDHFADVFALQAALRYAPAGPVAPIPLWLPAGLRSRMEAVLGEQGALEMGEAFEMRVLEADASVTVGDLTVVPRVADHADPAFSFVVEADDARLCYTSDTAYGSTAETAARGVQVLLAEATLPAEYAGLARHMTAAEAGALASASGAHTLVLTHLWPTVDRGVAERKAREAFAGHVIVADELTALDID